ncbi:MAG: hypothetical protein NC926_10810 [Candidatus Omnitrophica bacterium]|nr:hypothetical protein [Candidatus Omnitrophota bacterium]
MIEREIHRSLEKQEKEMMQYLMEFFEFYFQKLLKRQDERISQIIKTLRENKDNNAFRKNLNDLLRTAISEEIIIEFLRTKTDVEDIKDFKDYIPDVEYIGDLIAEINEYLEKREFLQEVRRIFNNYFLNNPENENFR